MGKKVAILSNEHSWTYNLRRETIARLLDEGYSVTLILPYGEKVELLKEMGCSFIDVPMFERRGKNPLKELRLISEYRKILKRENPDVVLTYTIKPNLYGGMVCSRLKIPYICNITGLGSAVEKSGIIPSLTKLLYKLGLKKASCVFAQNKGNKDYLINNKIVSPEKVKQIAGSGVNLSRFEVSEYPSDDVCRFVFISRLLKEKGIEDYIEAAKTVREKYPLTQFHVCGFCEDEYKEHLSSLNMEQYVEYHGMIDNVAQFLTDVHCLVHPSYYLEGTSNVCLEACASGRPVITTDHEGCRETVVDGKSGFIIPVRSPAILAEKIIEFIEMPYEKKKEMGLCARKHVEENFDREIIVRAYMSEIKKIEDK